MASVAETTAPAAAAVAAAGEPKWGSIKAVLNAPLEDVSRDEWWISVFFMWLLLPLNLIQGILGGLIKPIYVCFAIGSCCIPFSSSFCSVMGAVKNGRPLLMSWVWWRYVLSALIALIANGKSRLALFMWEWNAFGRGTHWWHGEGIWCWSYEDCDKLLRADQDRKPGFGAARTCTPDLYPTKLLIFLTSGPNTPWQAVRSAFHNYLLNHEAETFKSRVRELPAKLAEQWSSPKIQDMNDTPMVHRTVARCIFFVLFGKWLDEEDAKVMANWRAYAATFILPRMVQRVMFNLKINQVKKLRTSTVGIVEKHGLQQVFMNMNNDLGEFKKDNVVELCDEIMFGVGFAGIGGTSAACETCAAFLQCKIPEESAKKHIKWGQYDTGAKMVEKYKRNPEKYIREALRMDPPVTSATSVLKENLEVTLGGKQQTMHKGMFEQYVLSMANRDERVFEDPETFNPDRANLNQALTWNGAFGAEDEASYPRICPGRFLSLAVSQAILNHALGIVPTEAAI